MMHLEERLCEGSQSVGDLNGTGRLTNPAQPVMTDLSFNQHIADRLRQMADLLEQQTANPFRVSAYRHAADTVSSYNAI
jgi:Helix-hairpin-helix domain